MNSLVMIWVMMNIISSDLMVLCGSVQRDSWSSVTFQSHESFAIPALARAGMSLAPSLSLIALGLFTVEMRWLSIT